jgi:hypothetical protein
MTRDAKDFLNGFARAAQLLQRLLAAPPRHTTPDQYLEDVASLHARSDDLRSRGLVVGCLAAVGKA